MEIVVYHPDQTVNHSYVYSDWIDPSVTSNGKYGIFHVEMTEGDVLEFNGQTDGGAWWCGGSGQRTVLIAAVWNGQAMQITTKTVGLGCNFVVKAEDVACPANDQDCDGYTANNPDPTKVDCGDTLESGGPLIHPNQLETWGDQADTNCNGFVDPPSWKYTLANLAQGNLVELVNPAKWDAQQNDFVHYSMIWNGSTVRYEVQVGSWVAPTEYVIRYRASQNEDWKWSPMNFNNCDHQGLVHLVVETHYNTIVPFSLGAMCHYFKQ